MPQNYNSEVQQVHTRVSSPLAHVLSKRIAWFSIAMCLLLLAGIVGVTQKNVNADAASAKHASAPKHVSAPKHAPAPHHPTHPFRVGKMMPTMNVSPASLSFTESLAHPQVVTQPLTITNNGARSLYWHATLTTLQSPSTASWVSSYAPAKGTLGYTTTVQLTFTVKPSAQLKVGTYTAQLVLAGIDQQGTVIAGSPQTVNLTLNVTQ